MSKFSSPFLAKSPFNQGKILKKIADAVESWMPNLNPKRKKELDKIQKANPGMTRGEARKQLRASASNPNLKNLGAKPPGSSTPSTPAGVGNNEPNYSPPPETPAGMGDQSVNQWHKNKREWTDIGVSGIPGVPSIRNQK